MHPWKVDDEVWGRFYDWGTGDYVAGLLGRVTGVGPKGFTMRRVRPDHKGQVVERYPHDAGVWPTKEATEAHIAAHPFNTGRQDKG